MKDTAVLIGCFFIGLLFVAAGVTWATFPATWLRINVRFLGAPRDPDWSRKLTDIPGRILGGGCFVIFGAYLLFQIIKYLLERHPR